MNPLLKLDDSVDVEEVATGVPDNYLLCICENRENLKDRKKGDIVIGIMVSNFHDWISILGGVFLSIVLLGHFGRWMVISLNSWLFWFLDFVGFGFVFFLFCNKVQFTEDAICV